MTEPNHAYVKRDEVAAALLHEHDAKCPICSDGRKPLCPEGHRLWTLWAAIRRELMSAQRAHIEVNPT